MNKDKSASATDDTTDNKGKSKRIKYGFELNFPSEPFTIKNLSRLKKGKVKYITLYSRVKAALADGSLVIAGEKTPQHKTRGRRQTIYQRADAKTVTVAAAPVTETVVATETSPTEQAPA